MTHHPLPYSLQIQMPSFLTITKKQEKYTIYVELEQPIANWAKHMGDPRRWWEKGIASRVLTRRP